jgi:hypothetical protein
LRGCTIGTYSRSNQTVLRFRDTVMATAAPSALPDDLFQITIGRAKAWALALTSYFGSLAALVGGYFGLKKLFPDWNDALVLGIAVGPLVLTLLTVTLPAWLRQRRDRKLVAEGISGRLKDPKYFRIWPYEARDRERYSRPDGAHEEVLRWVRAAASPLLYLTGRSGTGKTSVLSAWVLPKLEGDEPPYRTLVVRSYRDPLAELVAGLGKLGTVWEKPPTDLPSDPRVRLERAAAYLGGKSRLLIVLDQFEEFVILHDEERRTHLEAFLRDLIERPIPNVTTLLVLRSDYLGVLDQLDLPPLSQRDNWREIGPFTHAAAATFLDGSGLQLGPELRAEVLKEASEVEENPGLIRPITLNMFGLVLSRFEGRLPRGFAAGRLLTGYIRGELNKPEVREHAVQIVRNMVTDAGTKHPRSEADLANKTKLDPALVRGCLLALGSSGLVRPLDEVNRVWEVAHDFVARLLAQVVGSWRTAWWRALQPWVAPASLVLWLGVLFAALPAYRAYVTEAPLAKLRAMGIPVIQSGDALRVSFRDAPPDKLGLMLRNAIPYLQEIPHAWLDLSGTKVADATPLAKRQAHQPAAARPLGHEGRRRHTARQTDRAGKAQSFGYADRRCLPTRRSHLVKGSEHRRNSLAPRPVHLSSDVF